MEVLCFLGVLMKIKDSYIYFRICQNIYVEKDQNNYKITNIYVYMYIYIYIYITLNILYAILKEQLRTMIFAEADYVHVLTPGFQVFASWQHGLMCRWQHGLLSRWQHGLDMDIGFIQQQTAHMRTRTDIHIV